MALKVLYTFSRIGWKTVLSFFSYDRFLSRCMECRHGLAMGILSVCPSVNRVICDKTKESCAHILIPHVKPFTLVL